MQDQFQVGEWTATPSLNLLAHGDTEVRVEPKVMDLLVCFAQKSGQVVTLQDLMDEVWEGVVVSDGSVYLLINRLRQALDDDKHLLIETIRKRGYRLNAPVQWSGARAERPSFRSALIPAGGALAAVCVIALGWVFFGSALEPAGIAGTENRLQPPDYSPEESMALRRIYTSTSLQEQLSIIESTPGFDHDEAWVQGLLAFLHSNALTNSYMAQFGEAGDVGTTRATVERYANAALAQEPAEVMAHLALGNMNFFDWRWSEAEVSFERALAGTGGGVSPGFAAYVLLSSYLGRHDRAIGLSEQMIETEPSNPLFSGFLGIALANAGNYTSAIEELEYIAGVLPNYWVARSYLVYAYVRQEKYNEAMRHIDIARADPYTLMLIGQHDEARRQAGNLLQRERDGRIAMDLNQKIRAHLVLGDTESALNWLQVAAQKAAQHEPEAGFFGLMMLKMNIAADETLTEPAFADVLARIHGD